MDRRVLLFGLLLIALGFTPTFAQSAQEHSKDEKELLEWYRSLPDEERQELREWLKRELTRSEEKEKAASAQAGVSDEVLRAAAACAIIFIVFLFVGWLSVAARRWQRERELFRRRPGDDHYDPDEPDERSPDDDHPQDDDK